MRRSDRAMSVVARRAPGLMRGMARLAGAALTDGGQSTSFGRPLDSCLVMALATRPAIPGTGASKPIR